MHEFPSCNQKNAVNMQAKCMLCGIQKARNLAFCFAVCRPLFSSYARQENSVKTMFFTVFGSLGAWFPPLLNLKSFATRLLFNLKPQNCMLRWHVWAFFWQTYCNLSCCKFASKQNSDFMKNTQNHTNCEVKPTCLCNKQLEAKSSPIAFSIVFSQSSHTFACFMSKEWPVCWKR